MKSANDQIRDYLADLENVQDKYTLNLINPYTRAFVNAKKNFDKTIDAIIKRKEREFEMVMLAFSLAGGGLFTSAFGMTASKALAKKAAINTMVKFNLEKAFNAAAVIEGSDTASYIIGKLWDEGEKYLTSQLKETLKPTKSNFNSTFKAGLDPLEARTYLQDYVLECKTKAHEIAAAVRDNNRLSESEKLGALVKLKSAPFYTPPAKSINEETMARDIELIFYLDLIFKSDRLVHKKSSLPYDSMGKIISKTDIKALPSSKKYPKEWKKTKSDRFHPYMSEVEEKYIVVELEREIFQRTNVLYKKRTGNNFRSIKQGTGIVESPYYDQAILLGLERELKKIGEETIERIKVEALAYHAAALKAQLDAASHAHKPVRPAK